VGTLARAGGAALVGLHAGEAAAAGAPAAVSLLPFVVYVLCISSKIYNFLEEARQAHEPAHRQPPGWLFYLIKAAQHPGFFPRGMARREQNRSRNNHRCFALLIFNTLIFTSFFDINMQLCVHSNVGKIIILSN